MPENVLSLYNSLDYSAQQEVCDFILFLIQKQKKEEKNHDKTRKENRLQVLKEFAGSMKDSWKGVDALEYQNQIRQDRGFE